MFSGDQTNIHIDKMQFSICAYLFFGPLFFAETVLIHSYRSIFLHEQVQTLTKLFQETVLFLILFCILRGDPS